MSQLIGTVNLMWRFDWVTANKLKATFRCEPVMNAAGKVIGARSVYDHMRFQEICGGGCSMDKVADYMGSTTKNLPTGKCGTKDGHTGNFLPLSKCHFNCDSGFRFFIAY